MASRSSSRGGLLVLALLGLATVVAAILWALWPDPVEVKTATASYQDLSTSVSAVGRVVPIDEFQARASFPGLVEKVFVHVGDVVQPGQLLMRMKDPFAEQRVIAAEANLETVRATSQSIQQNGSKEDQINFAADLKRATTERDAAKNALDMFNRLKQTGAASGAEVYAAAHRLDEANITLQNVTERSTHRYSDPDRASWKMRVADANATLQAQKVGLANANITSTIAGTVYLIPAAANDFVQMGADLLHVANLDRTEIRASFDEPDIGLLHPGAPVTITWDGKPNETWKGTVSRPPLAAIQRGNRSVGDCTIAVQDPRHELLPNTTVVVSVLTRQQTHRLSIPREALHTLGSQNFVYTIRHGNLHRIPVEIGMVTLTHVEILSGLKPDEVVALHLANGADLADDLRVKVAR